MKKCLTCVHFLVIVLYIINYNALSIVINQNRNRRNATMGGKKLSHSLTCVRSFDSSIISRDIDQTITFRGKRHQ